jgi:hypothetical protein
LLGDTFGEAITFGIGKGGSTTKSGGRKGTDGVSDRAERGKSTEPSITITRERRDTCLQMA